MEEDEVVVDIESIQKLMSPCSRKDIISLNSMSTAGSDELVFGEVVEVMLLSFFNLFLIVEFQKFLISLSVLPGSRAAI